MMKSHFPSRRALIFSLVVLVVAMLVQLPASLLALVFPSHIQLQNVEGSFWNGKASAFGISGVIVQEQVAWQLLPKALLEAQLLWDIKGRLSDKNSQLIMGLNFNGALLNNVNVVLPLEPLALLHPQLKPLQLGGTVNVSAKTIGMNMRWDAVVTIEHLFSQLTPQDEFGNFRANLRTEPDGKGNWQVTTIAGSNLRVTGNGTFDIRQNRGEGQVTLIPPPQMQGLSLALSTLPKVGEGYQFKFE
jgi:Bacterial type II secretion system protein N.